MTRSLVSNVRPRDEATWSATINRGPLSRIDAECCTEYGAAAETKKTPEGSFIILWAGSDPHHHQIDSAESCSYNHPLSPT